MRWSVLARLGLAVLLLFPTNLLGETVQGRIMEISRLANTIQIRVPDQDPVVIRFDANTRFVEAEGIGDLAGNDLIQVEFTPGHRRPRFARWSSGCRRVSRSISGRC